jgi:hypothetical protein
MLKYSFETTAEDICQFSSVTLVDPYWPSVTFCDLQWSSVIFNYLQWSLKIFSERQWTSVNVSDLQWSSVIFNDLKWLKSKLVDVEYIHKSSLCDIMPKSIDQDGESFGRLHDTSLYLLWWSMVLSHDWIYFAITPFIQLIIVASEHGSWQQKLGTYIRAAGSKLEHREAEWHGGTNICTRNSFSIPICTEIAGVF